MNLRHARTGVLGASALTLALTSACSSPPAFQTAHHKVIHLDASWADGYPSLAQMVHNADAIVIANVTGIADTGTLHSSNDSTGGPDAQTPYRDYSLTVTDVLKGSPPSSITVRQTGGTASGGTLVVVDGDPLLTTGERAILFLRQFAPGSYAIMGGPSGRLNVTQNDTVTVLPGSAVRDAPDGDTLPNAQAAIQADLP